MNLDVALRRRKAVATPSWPEVVPMASARRSLPRSFWIETVVAITSGALFALTLVWHDWLEALGLDPDHHDGTAEWFLVAALALMAAGNAVLARISWRRAAVA